MLNEEQQILEQIKKANNILITFNADWPDDGVATALALYLLLKKMDKKAQIVASRNTKASKFSFLPAFNKIQQQLEKDQKFIISLSTKNTKVKKVKYSVEKDALNFIITPKEGKFKDKDVKTSGGGPNYDLIICVNTPDLEALGEIYDKNAEFFYQTTIINIDHHSNNEEYGQINAVELTAAATAEIVFNLLVNYSRELIDEDIATCLLAGIIANTKSFKTQNITPQVLAATSQLIAMGGRREEIVNHLYRSRTINILKLWGRVLARLMSSHDNSLVWSVLTTLDFQKTTTTDADLTEIIDELIINIPQAKIVAIIYEAEAPKEHKTGQRSGQTTNAMIYALSNINILEATKPFNPIGSKKIVLLQFKQNLQEVEKNIINHLKNYLDKISFMF